jgi:type II secretory pathway component PulC
LYRDDVVQAVDAGFPAFLQKVEVEAALKDGKFVGWRVLSLHPPDFWSEVDLAPGDIVTQVNRLPIEREMQAYAAFQGLKTAPRLDVSLLRGAQVRSLSYEILPRPNDARVAAQ